jgi:hypothetical protein
MDSVEYLEWLGPRNNIATLARPDILYQVSVLAQKATKPTVGDLVKVKI